MPDALRPIQVVIAGYGLPGRVAAELLSRHHIAHCVIERNPITVQRCEKAGTPIIEGDCTDPQVLRRAGIESARAFLVLIPDEQAALQATRQARRLNAAVRILTRCHYTSCGIEAKSQGADDVIVAEQVVATEVARRTEALIDGW
ncbi:MAG TPA: NAD(P)-binding protein [Tepidisphaeraceae bacterium]|nr:NAD(P)-binding protein [Tepidisphaeraceae bacterium]